MSSPLIQTTSRLAEIRQVLSRHGRLSLDVETLGDDEDLYSAGLTSLATVGIMLALEDQFEVEFPESMLSRGTFRSLATIDEAISQLRN